MLTWMQLLAKRLLSQLGQLHLPDNWLTPHEQHGDVFFLCCCWSRWQPQASIGCNSFHLWNSRMITLVRNFHQSIANGWNFSLGVNYPYMMLLSSVMCKPISAECDVHLRSTSCAIVQPAAHLLALHLMCRCPILFCHYRWPGVSTTCVNIAGSCVLAALHAHVERTFPVKNAAVLLA